VSRKDPASLLPPMLHCIWDATIQFRLTKNEGETNFLFYVSHRAFD